MCYYNKSFLKLAKPALFATQSFLRNIQPIQDITSSRKGKEVV